MIWLDPAMTTEDTKTRLLDAAGQIFADRGFEAATIREICQQANANIAAINYYFGDKEQLYVATLKHAHACKAVGVPAMLPAGMKPEDKLRAFVAAMLQQIVFEETPAWHATLILREMVNPTRACEELVQDNIRPMAD